MSLTPAEKIAHHCRRRSLPRPTVEFQFVAFRAWKLDVAWPELLVGVDIQGGAFKGGHHSRGPGMRDDFEKLAHAVMRNWRVLLMMPEQVKAETGLFWIERTLRLAMSQQAG
jgi:hypothetical protein